MNKAKQGSKAEKGKKECRGEKGKKRDETKIIQNLRETVFQFLVIPFNNQRMWKPNNPLPQKAI